MSSSSIYSFFMLSQGIVATVHPLALSYLSLCMYVFKNSRTGECIFMKLDVLKFYKNVSAHSSFGYSLERIMDAS
jgi:hypothetical protein